MSVPPRARANAGRVVIAVVTLLLARSAIAAIYARLGHPGALLDDSFIHFQYARAIAELHPLRFQAGEPLSTGATSILWPALLAPFYLIGFRDLSILWPAWGLSFAALGMLAHEAQLLARPLAGRAAAIGAAAMVLAFGGFLWCAASGMEVVPFAWALARSMRASCEWVEPPLDRSHRRFWAVVIFAWVAALFRPEGAVVALVAGVALMTGAPTLLAKAKALLPIALPLLVPVALRVLAGSAQMNTAAVKLLVNNPYYVGPALREAIVQNARVFVGTLLNGEIWSTEFLPTGAAWVALLGLASLPICGWRRKRRFRAIAIVILALMMMIPCTYVTFLWNRLRYLWPFATGWFIGLACLARLLGDTLVALGPRWRVATPIAVGVFVGAFAVRLDGVVDDIAGSASGIDRQHVALGRWAKMHLPSSSRIGLNDTGAIAYESDRRTFDIVGLTTSGEGRYWVAGSASRFEHYERLGASQLPTHFIVYREWMACDAILGELLHDATVLDSTILGGTTMGVYRASYGLLGSGERPWTELAPWRDSVDVADLESERDHEYDLAGAHEGEEIFRQGAAPGGVPLADGGRGWRKRERFTVGLKEGTESHAILRVEAPQAMKLRVIANGASLTDLDVHDGEWAELGFTIPANVATGRTVIELHAVPETATFTTFHYWFY